FDADIIELCVRWYITYRLSYRDLVAMMAERGVEVSHTTILRWVVRYVPEFEKRWNRHARRIGSCAWRIPILPVLARNVQTCERSDSQSCSPASWRSLLSSPTCWQSLSESPCQAGFAP